MPHTTVGVYLTPSAGVYLTPSIGVYLTPSAGVCFTSVYMHRNKGPLGNFYRRIYGKAGAAVAIVVTARKLAVIYYNMMMSKQKYDPKAPA
jgi:hypothetical protein